MSVKVELADSVEAPFGTAANPIFTSASSPGTNSPTKFEDVAAADGDAGSASLWVRRDTNVARTNTDGDYQNPACDQFGNVKVTTSNGLGTDRSVTATTASAALMAANAGRIRFIIKNDTAIVVWINFGAAAVAAAGSGNISIAANGGYLELTGTAGAINIIAASTTAAITAREF